MLAFVPLPPWYSSTQPTLNVTKPHPFTHFAAKLFATSSRILLMHFKNDLRLIFSSTFTLFHHPQLHSDLHYLFYQPSTYFYTYLHLRPYNPHTHPNLRPHLEHYFTLYLTLLYPTSHLGKKRTTSIKVVLLGCLQLKF